MTYDDEDNRDIAQNNSIEVRRRSERHSSPKSEYYFDPLRRGRDGLILDILNHGKVVWSGIFAFGDADYSYVGFIGMTSNLLIVALGQGYVVDALRPDRWSALPFLNIREVASSQSFRAAVGCNDWKVFVVWDIDRVGSRSLDADGIHDLAISNGRVRGTYERKGGGLEHFSLGLDTATFPLLQL